MINVWCVCVGNKYSIENVANLARMINKHMPCKFEFKVLTESDLVGWWAKLDLLKQDGPNLYFDLDTVIVRDLTPLVEYAHEPLAMTRNWANSGHGGFQSSFMAWSSPRHDILDKFDPSNIGEPEGPEHCRNFGWYHQDQTKHWGDQEWLAYNFGDQITEVAPGLVVSYKYHCRHSLPEKACAVTFHGKPDYWEVKHDWIDEALS